MWAVGMKAVCVDTDDWYGNDGQPASQFLVLNKIYHVTGARNRNWKGTDIFCLRLIEFPSHKGFDARRFRKVLPDKHEGCSEEFKLLLKQSDLITIEL